MSNLVTNRDIYQDFGGSGHIFGMPYNIQEFIAGNNISCNFYKSNVVYYESGHLKLLKHPPLRYTPSGMYIFRMRLIT